jgi:PAS domain S-box-containing protein
MEGTLLAVNPSFAEILGYESPEEVVHSVTDSAHHLWLNPEERARFMALLTHRGTIRGYECQFRRKDGSAIWVSLNCRKIDSADGKTLCYGGFLEDLTERKRMEEALRLSAEIGQPHVFTQLMIDTSPAFIVVIGADGRIITMNPALLNALEYTLEEARGKDYLATFVPESERSAVAEDFEQMFAAGQSTRRENLIVSRSGRQFLVEWHGRPMIGPDGRARCFAGIGIDITERKRAEQSLRESEARFRSLVTATSQIVWTTDPQGLVAGDMPTWRTYTAQSRQEIQGWGWLQALHPDDHEKVVESWRQAIANRSVYDVECRIRRRDGQYRYFSVRGVPVVNEGNAIREWMGACTDIHERKELEEELRRSEGKFSAAFRSNPAGMVISDLHDGRIIDVNEAFEQLFGFRRDEVIGKTPPELNLWPALQRPEEWTRRLQAEGKISNLEVSARTKDGGVRMGLRSTTLIDVGGTTCSLSSTIDITERKMAEEALRKSEQRFRAIFDSAFELIGLLSPDGTLLEANRAALTVIGSDREAVVGRLFWETPWWSHSPEGRQKLRRLVERAASGAAQCGETDVWSTAGIRTIQFTLRPVLDEAGAVTQIIPEGRDITDLRQSYEALKRSEEKFRCVFDFVPCAIAILDLDGRHLEVSATLCHSMGLSQDEVLGRTVADFFDVRRHGEPIVPDGAFLRKICGDTIEVEFSNRRTKLTKTGLFSVKAFSVDGRPCYLACALDVTDLRKVEQQFRRAQKMEAIGRLAAGVAHDFNNLLTVISGYTQMALAQLPREGGLYDAISEVSNAADRAEALTRQLLVFSRDRAPQQTLTDLNGTIREARKMLERLLGENIEVQIHLSDELPAVLVDPAQMIQVVMNLAVNARDAMPDGGRLSIETSLMNVDTQRAHESRLKSGPHVCLRVRDTGMGMDEETQSHIFEPFYTTKPEGKGTGLGLSTVYGIVEQHRGSISVQSRPAEGTTFEILLPATEPAERPQDHELGQDLLSGTGTVLLAEDDDALRSYTGRILEKAGYRLLSAPSGTEALRLALAHHGPIDLLVTDLTMPGINGLELARQLLQRSPHTAVVYMSGYSDTKAVEELLTVQSVEFVQKPFSPAELLRHAKRALDAKR